MFEQVRPISDVALNILKKRYFKPGEAKWEDAVNRVVGYVCKDWDEEDRELIYDMLLNTYFVPNSPCLVNSNTRNGGLCACVPEYVRLPTNIGQIKISDIVDNNRATHVYDGNSITKIVERLNNGIKSVFRVYTERGHRLDLTNDHTVLVYGNKNSNSKFFWKTVEELNIGDILEFDNKGNSFPKEDFDPDLGILLGYLYSDGCFTEDKRKIRIIEFIVNSQEEKELILRLNNKFTGDNNLNVIDKEKYIRLHGYGKDRYIFLEKYQPFFGAVCRVPDEIFESNYKTISNFLSALFSADGSISVQKRGMTLSLSMSNESFIRDVGRLLELYGIRYSIHEPIDLRNDYNRLSNFVLTITDEYSSSLFNDNIKFFNPIKQARLEKYLQEKPLIGNQKHSKNLKLKVIRKELLGDFQVYDIQTESNKFLSDNFVVHNCFVIDFPDSIEGIYKTKLDFALIAKKGGGCGTTLSKLRPENSFVNGSSHGFAGGPIKFADAISHDMDALTQAGFRNMAMMFTMS